MSAGEYLLSLLITIMSIIITIATIIIAMYIIIHFLTTDNKYIVKLNNTNSNHRHHIHNDNVKIKRYFKLSASITVTFNALNAFFNTLYCIYLLLDPAHDDEMFYIYHPSHVQRITSTVSWYIAKISLVSFFTGRLYHGFKGSALRIKRKTILFINIFNTIFASVSLFIAYWSVYNYKQYLGIAELAFNLWRIEYQIVVFTILVMFSKRLLFLTVQELSINIMEHSTIICTDYELGNIDNYHLHNKLGKNTKEHRMVFVMITARNAILVLTISFTVLLVSFCFFGFRWVFGHQTRLTLLIPMNMAAFDSLITSICIICLFQIGDNLYNSLCKICDKKIYKLFVFMAQKQMTNVAMLRNNISGSKINSEIDLQTKREIDPVTPPEKLKRTASLTDIKSNTRKTEQYSETIMENKPVFELTRSNSVPVINFRGVHSNQREKPTKSMIVNVGPLIGNDVPYM